MEKPAARESEGLLDRAMEKAKVKKGMKKIRNAHIASSIFHSLRR